jgi:hypothetical protein
MKTKTRSKFYLPVAGIILTVAVAFTAAAQSQVPFKGTFQGFDSFIPPGTISGIITGNGTLVGQFSSTSLVNAGPSGGAGTAHWVSANGDSIDTTVVASGEHVDMAPCQVAGAQPEDTYFKVTSIQTIIGGSGRFAGAQGSFTQTVYHDVVPRGDGTNGTCGSYSGTITSPGAVH